MHCRLFTSDVLETLVIIIIFENKSILDVADCNCYKDNTKFQQERNKMNCLRKTVSLGKKQTFLLPAVKNIKNSYDQRYGFFYSTAKGDHISSRKPYSFYTIFAIGSVITAGYITLRYQNKKDWKIFYPLLQAKNDGISGSKRENDIKTIKDTKKHCDQKIIGEETIRSWHITQRQDLPTYQISEIQKHCTLQAGVWVTYGIGVYDITSFIPKHPGTDKIMAGAGNAIDPFWAIYGQHNTPEILKLLETYRIGNIRVEDEISTLDMGTPWGNEPKRNQLLKIVSQRPFNAEPHLAILIDNFYTPNELFFVRNHLPVPVIDVESYELEIDVETEAYSSPKKSISLNFKDIKALSKHSVAAAVMCGGNRRSEMAKVKSVKGLSWDAAAVGNAKWSGARLRDVLLLMGIQPNEKLHVIFEGADLDPTSHPYGASIPLSKALDERGEVLLAYEMNDKPLSPDHGYPLRVIVPGTVGARNVKWLTRIAISDTESPSHWQQNDYKGFNPSVDWDTVDFSKSPAIQAMPVTSAICSPLQNEIVTTSRNGNIKVRGYAWSGGGRRIIRVDLTADQGQTWHSADLDQLDLPDGRHYSWTLWSASIPAPKSHNMETEIWTRAVDSAYNVQPETFENIWNLRGVLSNAYHRVKIYLKFEE